MSFTSMVPRLASRRIAQIHRISISQFSTSSTSSAASSSSSQPKPKSKSSKVVSSVPAGTKLTGLSILKDKPDPVALEDDEYPPWLWTLLEDTSKAHKAAENQVELHKEGDKGFDVNKEKRKLKNLNREKIKASNYLKSTT
ncbi:50S small subunit ribosomal protein L37 [Kwoniella mangroviensis CBS 10435]|uniref:Large ribosomal subunit protein mL54 n=1 Tax=Kwoniella mangroviensis CBS 10435 TaxID=1331196 RepID=A0A1B9ITB6_9TREE|nr:50S small subunit ribosomal protein L37 [Kwoniella mangroviensis CBS 8507]OCF58781.1 50S small subunit ribosomal protein L37 [Kwoniella mangroviensis CBS 10435]OCF68570.1 50S small subunit ribosomal protein L37 [Kwoniella mangroviensis CBS 8507]